MVVFKPIYCKQDYESNPHRNLSLKPSVCHPSTFQVTKGLFWTKTWHPVPKPQRGCQVGVVGGGVSLRGHKKPGSLPFITPKRKPEKVFQAYLLFRVVAICCRERFFLKSSNEPWGYCCCKKNAHTWKDTLQNEYCTGLPIIAFERSVSNGFQEIPTWISTNPYNQG